MQKSASSEFLAQRDAAHGLSPLRRGATAIVTFNKYVNCTVTALM
jgi:hypothetical protein